MHKIKQIDFMIYNIYIPQVFANFDYNFVLCLLFCVPDVAPKGSREARDTEEGSTLCVQMPVPELSDPAVGVLVFNDNLDVIDVSEIW